MLRKLSLCLAFVLSVSGCQNATTPLNNTVATNNVAKKTKNIINGKVEFPSKFNTKAEISDIITNSTVSLIYPENYQDVALRSKSVASGLSDINGNFSLNADYSFDPIIGQIFILEATKRVNSTGGDAISLRTYVQWNGTYFKSITKNSIHVNIVTTAVAVMASFNTILPEDTIDKLDITNGQTQISDIANSGITSPMITYVKDLVELSLSKNQDPIGSIYYQQQKFLMKDISLGVINKLKGCISSSGNCSGINANIPTVASLGDITNTSYVFRTEDIKVNTTSLDTQVNPAIAVNRSGAKVVTWVSSDGNGTGIIAQRYDSTGAKVGNEFRVNSDTGSNEFNEYGCKTVAISDDGSFIVVWTQWDNDNLGVWSQKFNADGTKNGTYFRINDTQTNLQRYPSISARGNGDYVVTWSSYGQDGSEWGVYAKQLFADGTTSSEIAINTTTNSQQFLSDVAVNSSGKFVITWTSLNGIWDIYAQKFNADGTKDGVEFKVNTSGNMLNHNPTVALDSNNNFLVTWFGVVDLTNGFDIMTRRFNSDGSSTDDILVNTNIRLGDQFSPKISTNDTGNFVISWHDTSGNDGSGYGIHARKFNSDGSANGDDFIISKYRRKSQRTPLVSIDNSGKYSIVWDSYGQDGSEYGIYMQNFNFANSVNYSPISGNTVQADVCVGEGGICLKGEQQINSFTMGNQQEVSTATNKSNGNHVAVWVSEYQDGSGNGIFAQMYNSSGQKQGGEIGVNGVTNDEQTTTFGSRNVGMDNNGNFVVVWQSFEGGNYQIRLQKFNSSGQKVGDQLRVNDSTGTEKLFPTISMNGNGDYVITWSSYQGADSFDIFAKKFNANGQQTSLEFKVNSVVTGEQRSSDVHLSDDGTYIITWGGFQNNKWESFAQRFDADNSLLGSEFMINQTSSSENFNPTVVKDSSGRYIFTWHKQNTTTGYDVMARTMDSSGNLGNEFIVTNASGEQGNPKIALLPNNQFIITWNDLSNLDGGGNKIKAKIFGSDLNLVGSEINVNSFKGNNQYTSLGANQAFPKVATDNTGAFNIVWTSEGQDGSGKSVHIKRYNSNGTEK